MAWLAMRCVRMKFYFSDLKKLYNGEKSLYLQPVIRVFMENKTQLEILTGYLNRLTMMTAEIRDRDIYPVSFFSEAFDITHRMQELLHRMEVEELTLFERQMRVHQAQIQSVGRLSEQDAPENTGAGSGERAAERTVTAKPVPPVRERPPVLSAPPPPPVRQQPVTQKAASEKAEAKLNEAIEKKRLSDLRKAFTLNDRFRFCRDLFGRDDRLMNRTVAELEEQQSYEASVAWLQKRFGWNFEDETVTAFLAILEKRFS
jgi:hypothetical protein